MSLFYRDWINEVSKWKKFLPHIGVLFSALFLYFFISTVNHNLLRSSIFLIVAILILEDCLRRKSKWLKKVRKIPGYNQDIEIQFHEDQIIIQGENFKSEMEWNYFTNHTKTSNGLFLIPMKGSSIFIHQDYFEDKTKIEEIIKKLK